MKVVIELGNHLVWWATWRRAEGSARLDPQTLREIVFLLALPLLMPIPFEAALECRPKLNYDDDRMTMKPLMPSSTRLACTSGATAWFVLTDNEKLPLQLSLWAGLLDIRFLSKKWNLRWAHFYLKRKFENFTYPSKYRHF